MTTDRGVCDGDVGSPPAETTQAPKAATVE